MSLRISKKWEIVSKINNRIKNWTLTGLQPELQIIATPKNNYFIKFVTNTLQLSTIYLENNFISALYFTFINSSVTLINNYTTSMANSNVTTESGGRQNMFPTETRPYIDESVSYDSYPQNAEKVNGRWAMIGLVALVGAYVSTGQIIPGIF